jgi:hypothetical protein
MHVMSQVGSRKFFILTANDQYESEKRFCCQIWFQMEQKHFKQLLIFIRYFLIFINQGYHEKITNHLILQRFG